MHPHHAPTLAGKAHKHWVVNIGVADGARTHDNRNHNPCQNLASMRVGAKFFGIYSAIPSTIWRHSAGSIPKK
jgi:hypothetical protein